MKGQGPSITTVRPPAAASVAIPVATVALGVRRPRRNLPSRIGLSSSTKLAAEIAKVSPNWTRLMARRSQK